MENDRPPLDRHARRKAQTRLQIRRAAQRLFANRGFEAVTIADIATRANVAVQTVFNHFCSKEELFFEGYTRWVDGPAEAVRARRPETDPLTALRRHLVETVRRAAHFHATTEGRRYVAALAASPALRAHELELFHTAERQVSDALAEAWGHRLVPAADADTSAAFVAATWLAALRTLVLEHRSAQGRGEPAAAEAAVRADRVFRRLEEVVARWGDGTHRAPAAVSPASIAS